MLNIHTFLQGIYSFVKSISKKAYRTCVVIASGAAIVAVVSLASNDFGGAGKSKTGDVQLSAEQIYASDEDDEDDETLVDLQIGSVLKNDKQLAELFAYYDNYDIFEFKSVEEIKEIITESKTEEMMLLAKESEESTTQIPTTVEQTTQEPETQQIVMQETVQEPTALGESHNVNTVTASSGVRTLSDEDYEALCRIVHCEAGNQDAVGKILVANVILNRVDNERFPNSVKEVVFQKTGNCVQFSPTRKGGSYYKLTPTQDTIDCVNRALAGEDYSEGALFFSCKSSSKSWFNTKLQLVLVHGPHYFYKYK